MKLKIPVEVDLNGIDDIVDEIKSLQTYKLSADDDMELVSLDDVAEILINHIEAKRKSEPQRMRGRWKPTEPDEPCFYQCSLCRRLNDEKDNFCKNCGAKMEGTE